MKRRPSLTNELSTTTNTRAPSALRPRDGSRLEYVDIFPDDGWKHHAVHRGPAALCSRVCPRSSTRCSAQSQFVHRVFDSRPTWRSPPEWGETGTDLLVPVWHWSSQFQTDGQVVLRAIHDGKFGAAKDHRKRSFGAGIPSLWRRRTFPLVQVDRRSDAR